MKALVVSLDGRLKGGHDSMIEVPATAIVAFGGTYTNRKIC